MRLPVKAPQLELEMTIQFQGHVDQVDLKAPSGHVRVKIHIQSSVSDEPLYLNIPYKDAAHWVAGRAVSVTAYTLPAIGLAADA